MEMLTKTITKYWKLLSSMMSIRAFIISLSTSSKYENIHKKVSFI